MTKTQKPQSSQEKNQVGAFVKLQYILPKKLLTIIAGKIANAQMGNITTLLIRVFIKRYKVDMSQAENPAPESYKTFNKFFTRKLKEGARPIDRVDFTCPVDGAISQSGKITGEQTDEIFQAKGRTYTLKTLLADNSERKRLAPYFLGGNFATIYLSPRDYHRIHMPCDARLTLMRYVPGDLFSVNPQTARGVENLFARNERVICQFDTEHGAMSMILVGATIVGSIATKWHGIVTPPRNKNIKDWDYEKNSKKIIELKKGEEMGRFLLGSTVIMLWEKDRIHLEPDFIAEKKVQMGQAMGDALS